MGGKKILIIENYLNNKIIISYWTEQKINSLNLEVGVRFYLKKIYSKYAIATKKLKKSGVKKKPHTIVIKIDNKEYFDMI